MRYRQGHTDQEKVKQAQVCCSNRFANPPGNRKQTWAISLNMKSDLYEQNLKTTPSFFVGPDLHVMIIRVQSIS